MVKASPLFEKIPRVARTDEQHWDSAQEGAELILDGQLDEAIALLDALAAAEPDNPYAYGFLGNALFEQGSYVRALRSYLTALELAPEYLGAMVGIGQSLRLLGRYQEAIRMGRQILSRAPADGDALYLIGTSHFALGDNAAASRYLEKFLATGPELEVATEVQGMLQVVRGQVLSANGEEDDG